VPHHKLIYASSGSSLDDRKEVAKIRVEKPEDHMDMVGHYNDSIEIDDFPELAMISRTTISLAAGVRTIRDRNVIK